LVLPKSVVRDPIKGFLEHVDLISVRRGEKVVVEVAVHPEGKPDPDGILETVSTFIEVRAEATNIPNALALDIEGMTAGESRYARDVQLPQGIELVSDPDMLILHLGGRLTAEALEASLVVSEPAPMEEPAPAAESTEE
jgi:large subunit ribosomal protein L25